MENKALISSAIQYQKTASDNMFSILATLQNGGEKMIEETLDKCFWFPETGKEGLVSWYDTCAKTTDSFKQMIDQGYEEAQKFFESFNVEPQTQEKPVNPAAQPIKKAKAAAVRKRQSAKPKPAGPRKTAAVKKTATSKTAPVATETASKSSAAKPAGASETATSVRSQSADSNKNSTVSKTTAAASAKATGTEK